MNLFNDAAVLSINVFETEFHKKETVFVPERDFHSLTFRRSGKISITTNGETVISCAPGITFVPKGTGYSTEIIESGSMIAVHFDMTSEADAISGVKVYNPGRTDIFFNLFSSLFNKYTAEDTRGFACMSLFYGILSELSREISDSENNNISKRMKDARLYINKNFANPDLSVGLVSREFGVSEVYLRKEFKKAFELSPLSYIKKVRFDNAKAMFETGYYSVGEVAEKCGFTSLGYFSYAFHKEFGISPSDYRDLR